MAARLALAANGDLSISIGGQEIRQSKPTVYQDIDGHRRSVEGKYILRGSHDVGFEIGKYDRRRPLIIDPQLVYSTYANSQRPYGIALDSAGNAYISGTGIDGGPQDQATSAFVAK